MPLVIIKGYKKGTTLLFNSDDIKLVKKDKDDAENRHEILLKNLDASYYTLDSPEDILKAIKQAEAESSEAEINGLKNTITDLTKWKESMMKVHSELDLQGIGTALGLPLGSSIAPQVLPKVKELTQQNREIVSVLKKMLDFKKYQRGDDFISIEELEELLTKYNHLYQM